MSHEDVNYVIYEKDKITKYSPKIYVDFSIELEYSINKYLWENGIRCIPEITDYTFDAETCETCFEMPIIKGKLLYSLLSEKQYSEQDITNIFLNVLATIATIHNVGVTHGDMHGNNLIMVPTEEKHLEWNINGRNYKIPSVGFKPYIIDFGLGHVEMIDFRSEMAVTHANCLTSFTSDMRMDVLFIIRAIAHSQKALRPLVADIVSRASDNALKQPCLPALSDEITTFLKTTEHCRRQVYGFLDSELYNIIRCFPREQLSWDTFPSYAKKFFKYLCRQKIIVQKSSSGKDIRTVLCKKLKVMYYEQSYTEGMAAGSSVINFLIDHFGKIIKKSADVWYDGIEFGSAISALEYFYNLVHEE